MWINRLIQRNGRWVICSASSVKKIPDGTKECENCLSAQLDRNFIVGISKVEEQESGEASGVKIEQAHFHGPAHFHSLSSKEPSKPNSDKVAPKRGFQNLLFGRFPRLKEKILAPLYAMCENALLMLIGCIGIFLGTGIVKLLFWSLRSILHENLPAITDTIASWVLVCGILIYILRYWYESLRSILEEINNNKHKTEIFSQPGITIGMVREALGVENSSTPATNASVYSTTDKEEINVLKNKSGD